MSTPVTRTETFGHGWHHKPRPEGYSGITERDLLHTEVSLGIVRRAIRSAPFVLALVCCALAIASCGGRSQSVPSGIGLPEVLRKDATTTNMCSVYAGFGTLSACYNMDETSGTTLTDSSGAGHNGTISPGGVTYHVAGLASGSTYAELTNGSTGALTSGYSPASGSFSVSFFVSLSANQNNYGHLAATGDPYTGASSASGWNIDINENAGNNVFAKIGYGSGVTQIYGAPLALNTPENVTLTYNASTNAATLCVGNTATPQCVSATVGGTYLASGNPIVFGGGSAYYPANATFDEAAFWQGTVLTASQIDTIAGDAAPASATPAPTAIPASMCTQYAGYGSLSACYNMDEASGTTLTDSSGAGHNGTISSSGVTYHAAGLATNSTYGELTNGSSGALTSGFSPTSGSFSVSFFVSLSANQNNYGHLAATGDPYTGASSASGWNIDVNENAGNNVFAKIGYGSGVTQIYGAPLPLNTPENVTLTYNASTNAATLCVGNTATPQCVSATIGGTYLSSGNPIVFGGGSKYYPANATFDEAAFWQGTVLSSSQTDAIAADTSSSGATPAPTATPASMCSIYAGFASVSACYNMDEASGTTLTDSSGAGHNGAISPGGVTYHAAGLATNSTYAELTNGASGALTSGFSPTTGSFSVSFFVSLHANAGNYPHLAATGDPFNGSTSVGWNIDVNTDSANTVFAKLGYGTGQTTVYGIPLPFNTPSSVTLTYSASTNVATLCLGATSSPACTSQTLPSAYVASGSPIVFGGGSEYYPANATFDEAAFWQGTVLTSTQIGTIASHTAGSGATPAPTATPAPAPTSSASFNDYSTFGYDNQRDVFNPNSTAITPASIPNVHLAWQTSMDDFDTQSQPILATEIPSHAGVLFVGGGTGNLDAYDATTGSKLWSTFTGQMTYSCENGYNAEFGVGGSVAYDPSSKTLYVSGNSNTAANAPNTNTLYHIDGASGTVLAQVNVEPSPAGASELDLSHTSVTLGSNGLAYVGLSAACDVASWRGRVAAVQVSSMTLAGTYFTVWNNTTQPWGGGGVWGWGGVSLDTNNNVYTGVGNTDNGITSHGTIEAPFTPAPEEYSSNGDAFIELSSNLSSLEASNHPIPPGDFSGNSIDLDLNGTPALFTPNGAGCDTLAAVQGKSGSVYLYNTTKIGSGPVGQYQLAPSTYADGFLGGPAYSPVTGLLYVGVSSSNSSLYAPGMIAIDPGCGSPSVAWNTTFGPDSYPAGVPRSVPAVTAGGVVIVATPCTPASGGGCTSTTTSSSKLRATASSRRPAICCAPTGSNSGAVWAINASTGAVLNGGLPLFYTDAPVRAPPTVDGDWIYVLDFAGNLYGLTTDPTYPPISTQDRAPSKHLMMQWETNPNDRVR